MENIILHGDCINQIPKLADRSVSVVITSPPYAQQRMKQYAGVAEAEYPKWTCAWMQALRPKLTADASVVINIRPHVRKGCLSDYVLRTRMALPDAIGGVLDYRVQVDAKKNSDLGTLVDGPLVSSPLIAGMRLMHGIKSRSGDPKWKMRGRVKGTDRQVEVTIPTAGPIETYIRQPVNISPGSMTGTTTFAQPDRDEFLRKLVADYARKGKSLVFGREVTLGSEIELDLSFDERKIKRGMLKIAFAALYEYLGDQFLNDPLIPEWHKALFSASDEEAMSAKIHGVAFDSPEMMKIMLPDLKPHEHAVSIANIQQTGPIVAVSLFGHGFHHLLALGSESSNYGLRVLEGKIAICDSKAGNTRFIPFEEHFVNQADVVFPT